MIGKVAALALVAAASADITFNCARTNPGRWLVRVSSPNGYFNYEMKCDAGNLVNVNGADNSAAATFVVPVPTGESILVLNRANSALTIDADTGSFTCQSTNRCEGTPAVGATITATTATANEQFWFYDCAETVGTQSVLLRTPTSGAAPAEGDKFTCSSTVVTAPTNIPTTIATQHGILAVLSPEAGMATPDVYDTQLLSGGAVFVGITRNYGGYDTDPSTTCAPGSMGLCTITDGIWTGNSAVSFDFSIQGGVEVVPVATCEYTCTAFGPSTATCATATAAVTTGLCAAGATTVVTVPCTATNTAGQVVCVSAGGAALPAAVAAIEAAIALGANPNVAYTAFVAALIAQNYGVAVSAECRACVNVALANGGNVICLSCTVLTVTAAARQGGVVNPNVQVNGVALVVCPQATAAAQLECLQAAACAGALAGNVQCSVQGQGVVCPTCLVVDDESSSSKKGLLGLLGLLAIIPAVLLLLCSSILCCLLLKKRKRAVPVAMPTVVPTFQPMTVCEPAMVCGTSFMGPGASPYGQPMAF